MKKKILYLDMDNVLVDFQSGIDKLSAKNKEIYRDRYDEVPNIFSLMKPLNGALEAIHILQDKYDIYILSTAPWNNPSAWSDKMIWIKKYLGDICYKKLILTHHKNLNQGDILIDDRKKNGAGEFEGELLLFGSDIYPNWHTVVEYLT